MHAPAKGPKRRSLVGPDDHEGVVGGRSEWRAALRVMSFLLLTGMLLTVTDVVVNVGVRQVRTSTFGVFNAIVDGRINAALLITGSSRAMNHFDPRVLQAHTGLTAFNIGVNGSQTDMQVAVLETYLSHNRKPELVIHSLDSFAFVTSRDGIWFPAQYFPYLGERPIRDALNAVDPDSWKVRRIPLYGYAVDDMHLTWLTGLRGLAGLHPREDRHAGFAPRREAWSHEFARFREGRREVAFTIDPQGVKDFEQLLVLCRRRGVPVLLVYSPVYYEMQALETNRAQLFSLFQDLAERYEVPLWDYSGSAISRHKEYFVNSQHMNAEGAAAFSSELAIALKRSTLVTAPPERWSN